MIDLETVRYQVELIARALDRTQEGDDWRAAREALFECIIAAGKAQGLDTSGLVQNAGVARSTIHAMISGRASPSREMINRLRRGLRLHKSLKSREVAALAMIGSLCQEAETLFDLGLNRGTRVLAVSIGGAVTGRPSRTDRAEFSKPIAEARRLMRVASDLAQSFGISDHVRPILEKMRAKDKRVTERGL